MGREGGRVEGRSRLWVAAENTEGKGREREWGGEAGGRRGREGREGFDL